MSNPAPRAAVKKRHDTMNLWFSQIWDDAVKATGFETKNNA